MAYFESSDELKEQRREQAKRWLEERRLIFVFPDGSVIVSLLLVLFLCACLAVLILVFKLNICLGIVTGAIVSHWLILVPLSKNSPEPARVLPAIWQPPS